MYGKSLYENDDVIRDIEKFMLEYENPRMSPILVHKGRIYDSDKDLLNVLDPDNDRNHKLTTPNLKDYRIPLKSHSTAPKTHDQIKKNNVSPVNLKPKIFSSKNQNKKVVSNSHKGKTPEISFTEKKCSIPTCTVPPKKRKVLDEEESPPKKSCKETKKEAKTSKIEDAKRPRGRPHKLHKGTNTEFKKPAEFKCAEVMKEKATSLVQVKDKKCKAKVSVDRSYCDAELCRNIIVKEEVIDLTDLNLANSFYMCLKFGEEHTIEWETAEEIPPTVPVKARVVDVSNELVDGATVFIPDVRIDTNSLCIDLTRENEEEPVIASEKQLANDIIPIIFDCNSIYEAKKKVEDSLQDIQNILSPVEIKSDIDFTMKFMPEHTVSLGYNLIKLMSNLFVRNLDIQRFLDILSSKIKTNYGVILKPPMISSFLLTMMSKNRASCTTQLTRDLLQQLEHYTQELKVKEEKNSEPDQPEVIFTQEQLKRLKQQIEQYQEIVRKQGELLRVDIVKTEPRVLDKLIKQEMLDAVMAERPILQKNSNEPAYVFIIDD